MAKDNNSLGKFNLNAIPQEDVEVIFDVDERGVLNVEAKYIVSGKT